jgi:hypothetical protein
VYSSQGNKRCADFGLRLARRLSGGFIRRPSGGFVRLFYGGLFSVKVAAVKRNANRSLSVTPMEPHG